MIRVLALCSDLLLASRVDGSLRAAGHQVTVRPGDSALTDLADFDLVVADLDAVSAEPVAAAAKASLGFYSHVDVETRKRAEQAGFDLVVPRSRMARELPALVESMLG